MPQSAKCLFAYTVTLQFAAGPTPYDGPPPYESDSHRYFAFFNLVQVTVTVCETPPSPRASFTVTSLPSGDMVLFGGEFFDGQDAKCFNELFR